MKFRDLLNETNMLRVGTLHRTLHRTLPAADREPSPCPIELLREDLPPPRKMIHIDVLDRDTGLRCVWPVEYGGSNHIKVIRAEFTYYTQLLQQAERGLDVLEDKINKALQAHCT